jgi:hypothetical protein
LGKTKPASVLLRTAEKGGNTGIIGEKLSIGKIGGRSSGFFSPLDNSRIGAGNNTAMMRMEFFLFEPAESKQREKIKAVAANAGF